MGILDDIVRRKEERISAAKARMPLAELRSKAADAAPARPFDSAVRRGAGAPLRVIAELKKASPSRGLIRPDFNPESIARTYTAHGASALSVLTEEDFFQGSLGYLGRVKGVTTLPILRKDFIIDDYQIHEARAAGADAVLLIAAILSRTQADDLLQLARETGLQVLFEVHHWKELETVLLAGSDIIGINNRDLRTLEISLQTTIDLLRDIPEGTIVVSESGISRRADVDLLANTRVDALLVGTSLMKSADIGEKFDELFKKAP